MNVIGYVLIGFAVLVITLQITTIRSGHHPVPQARPQPGAVRRRLYTAIAEQAADDQRMAGIRDTARIEPDPEWVAFVTGRNDQADAS